jgi:alanine dehydrogenase
MLVGVPSEIKNNEACVGLISSSVQELLHHGHQVMVQSGAGLGAGVAEHVGVRFPLLEKP